MARHETVPVDGAEGGPCGHRTDVGTFGAHPLRGVPRLQQPAQLLLAGGPQVALGDGERPVVALPGLQEQAG